MSEDSFTSLNSSDRDIFSCGLAALRSLPGDICTSCLPAVTSLSSHLLCLNSCSKHQQELCSGGADESSDGSEYSSTSCRISSEIFSVVAPEITVGALSWAHNLLVNDGGGSVMFWNDRRETRRGCRTTTVYCMCRDSTSICIYTQRPTPHKTPTGGSTLEIQIPPKNHHSPLMC